jgi:hypothetical protein
MCVGVWVCVCVCVCGNKYSSVYKLLVCQKERLQLYILAVTINKAHEIQHTVKMDWHQKIKFNIYYQK